MVEYKAAKKFEDESEDDVDIEEEDFEEEIEDDLDDEDVKEEVDLE